MCWFNKISKINSLCKLNLKLLRRKEVRNLFIYSFVVKLIYLIEYFEARKERFMKD